MSEVVWNSDTNYIYFQSISCDISSKLTYETWIKCHLKKGNMRGHDNFKKQKSLSDSQHLQKHCPTRFINKFFENDRNTTS